MHKGYTLNYFIRFFSNIPTSQWTEGAILNDTNQCCALGHAGDARGSNVGPRYSSTNTRGLRAQARVQALVGFLGNRKTIAAISDGATSEYATLGATPRGRILRALRNRKRTGNVLGTRS